MRKLAIVFAVGAAALMGGSAAYAADNSVKAKPSTDAGQSATDFSAHRRYYRGYRHYGYRPYYRSYGYYAPRRYGYYGPRYYGGGPGVTFSFGTGGYRGWY
ncbi:hypothetical protein IVB30_39905 [Bradyrhizobium sp. 200]|uniref:hypothetical protein n=1 Tax=Bradyrhizobium sp. 200 TaxID=2782665 RepID=UPI001FFFA905|nr:hypothetical protein [Bradyrhizobium sp. 200]UPJ49073.1 hypothetical protein IVB30_39905 [Bradyrhizobium sp. 200]